MSILVTISGIMSTDSNDFRKHEAVLDACIAADIKLLPKETAEFFGTEKVSIHAIDNWKEKYRTITIPHEGIREKKCQEYIVNVADIPENLDKIVFSINY